MRSGGVIPQRYLNARQAAAYLGFGDDDKAISAIYQRVHRGTIPYARIGRILRFDIQALDAWVGRHGIDGTHGRKE